MSIQNQTADPSLDDTDCTGYLRPYYECEIPAVLAAIIGITSDIIIINTIVKFDNLKTQSNKYILHWCICNIFLLILVPTCFHMFALTCFMPVKIDTLIYDITLGFTVGSMIFTSLLISDWYICTHSITRATKYRQYSKFMTLLGWVVVLALDLVTIIFAINDISFPIIVMLLSLGSTAEVLLVIVINILTFKNPVSSNITPLSVVSVYVLFWSPSWFYMFHHSIYLHSLSIPYQVEYILMAIGFSNPAAVLYLMYRYDETFKSCLRMQFKSERRRHIELEAEHRENCEGQRQNVSLI